MSEEGYISTMTEVKMWEICYNIFFVTPIIPTKMATWKCIFFKWGITKFSGVLLKFKM